MRLVISEMCLAIPAMYLAIPVMCLAICTSLCAILYCMPVISAVCLQFLPCACHFCPPPHKFPLIHSHLHPFLNLFSNICREH